MPSHISSIDKAKVSSRVHRIEDSNVSNAARELEEVVVTTRCAGTTSFSTSTTTMNTTLIVNLVATPKDVNSSIPLATSANVSTFPCPTGTTVMSTSPLRPLKRASRSVGHRLAAGFDHTLTSGCSDLHYPAYSVYSNSHNQKTNQTGSTGMALASSFAGASSFHDALTMPLLRQSQPLLTRPALNDMTRVGLSLGVSDNNWERQLQRKHLHSAWPDAEPELVEILANHTDPYRSVVFCRTLVRKSSI
ncbi:unnamed protein product [Protopolystoma xenopodis]|uniref:Uncharacterized protein n=1 Tax=Protopolystoma xenopodis TaxID=117903 RepID=A0A448WUI7_9PLAT|nr:unnamed protein product [Protopolystoma xenopodis]